MTDPRGVHESVAAIAARAGRHRREWPPATSRAAPRSTSPPTSCFPMASCFKIPVMVEVMRRVDAGALRLDDRLTLTEADKSPGQHADPLPRGAAPQRARPPLPDDHAERQHGHRHALAARGPRLRQRDHAAARPGDHRLLHAEPRVLPHRVRAPARSGPASAAPRSSPAGGRSRRAASTRRRSAASSRRTRASAAPASSTCTSGAGAATSRCGYEDSFAVDQALDNQGTPRDMAELLAMIAAEPLRHRRRPAG